MLPGKGHCEEFDGSYAGTQNICGCVAGVVGVLLMEEAAAWTCSVMYEETFTRATLLSCYERFISPLADNSNGCVQWPLAYHAETPPNHSLHTHNHDSVAE
jgi:hypothetical protein